MLRWLLLVLVAANALFFSWSQGLWVEQGWVPVHVNEPERLQQELQASAIRLLNSPTDAAEPSPPPVATVAPVSTEPLACWWSPGFSPGESNTLRQAMDNLGLPDSAWSLSENRTTGRWIVYWGKFETPEVMALRKASLRRLEIDYREVTVPRLAPGLALGTYSTEEAAEEALASVKTQGVRTARVAMERAETVSWALRLPAVTEAQRLEVSALGSALAGKALLACP